MIKDRGGRGSQAVVGITVFAATEKSQLNIEGGGGQRTYFLLIKNSEFTGTFDVIPLNTVRVISAIGWIDSIKNLVQMLESQVPLFR